jgi:hypothetical protein
MAFKHWINLVLYQIVLYRCDKAEFIDINSLKAGLVFKAEKYVYSIAVNYVFGKQVGKVSVAYLTLYKQRTFEYCSFFWLPSSGTSNPKPVTSIRKLILKFRVPSLTP